jgi:hypothetical protein
MKIKNKDIKDIFIQSIYYKINCKKKHIIIQVKNIKKYEKKVKNMQKKDFDIIK